MKDIEIKNAFYPRGYRIIANTKIFKPMTVSVCRAYYHDGAKVKDLAEFYDVTTTTIYVHLNKFRVRWHIINDTEVGALYKRMHNYYMSGASYDDVANRWGISKRKARLVCSEYWPWDYYDEAERIS